MSEVLGPFTIPEEGAKRVDALVRLVEDLWLAVQDVQNSLITPSKTAPSKPREGMIRYADGTNWDPGSGAGLYQYLSGNWMPLF